MGETPSRIDDLFRCGPRLLLGDQRAPRLQLSRAIDTLVVEQVE
jgi:hypothetical protein